MLKQETSVTRDFIDTVNDSIKSAITPNADTVTKGKQFAKWVITRLFNASEQDFEDHYTDGANDHGIDFWILDPGEEIEGGVIQLFQLKYGTAHKQQEIWKFHQDVKTFFELNPNNIERDELKDIIREKNEQKLEPELFYITNEIVKNPHEVKGVNVYGFNQIVEKLWDDLFSKPKDKIAKLKLEKFVSYDHSLMGVVSLQELGRFVRANKSYIFESNIRKFLGSKKTKVNQLLQATINKNSEDFFKYNNGITMVASKFKILESEIELFEPQILN